MLGERFNKFLEDPFTYYDGLSVNVKGWELNVFRDHAKFRYAIGVYTVLCTALWVLMGWDSTVGQIEYPFFAFIGNLYDALTGSIPWSSVWEAGQYVEHYLYQYGKSMHWSAFTFYGALFWFTSRHLEKDLGLTGSRNTVFSLSFMFFNIGVFEWFWMGGFAVFQNQWWVVRWAWPQLRILIQNTAFTLIGVVAVVLFWAEGYLLDGKGDVVKRIYSFKKWMPFMLALAVTVYGCYYWINMGTWYDYKPLTVEIEGYGEWSNTPYFVQTLYTVDVDLTDNVNAGVWHFIEDDFVHGVNNVVKLLFCVAQFCWVWGWRREV